MINVTNRRDFLIRVAALGGAAALSQRQLLQTADKSAACSGNAVPLDEAVHTGNIAKVSDNA